MTGRINRLEATLGVQLIARTSRRLSLTPDGERLRAGAARVAAELDALFAGFGLDHPGERPVAVACTAGVAALFMPALVRALSQVHPAIHVNLLDLHPQAALDAVRSARADLAVMAVADTPQGVAFEPLVDDDCVVIVPAGHKLLLHPQVRLAEVLEWPILMTDQQVALRHTVERLAQARGLIFRRAPDSRNASSLFGMFSMVAAGFGLMIQPRTLARVGVNIGLATLEIADVRIPHPYGLVLPASGLSSPAARSFGAFARQYATQLKG